MPEIARAAEIDWARHPQKFSLALMPNMLRPPNWRPITRYKCHSKNAFQKVYDCWIVDIGTFKEMTIPMVACFVVLSPRFMKATQLLQYCKMIKKSRYLWAFFISSLVLLTEAFAKGSSKCGLTVFSFWWYFSRPSFDVVNRCVNHA